MSDENVLPASLPLPTKKLWTPNAVSAFTFLLGFPSGITLASINWFRMGKKKKAFAHILGGVFGIAILFLLPDNLSRAFALLVNLGFLAYLRHRMTRDFEQFEGYDIQNAHWFSGVLFSLMTWGTILLVIGVVVFLSPLAPEDGPNYYAEQGDKYFNKGEFDRAIAEHYD